MPARNVDEVMLYPVDPEASRHRHQNDRYAGAVGLAIAAIVLLLLGLLLLMHPDGEPAPTSKYLARPAATAVVS
jgi:hypothetical protein